MERTIPIFN